MRSIVAFSTSLAEDLASHGYVVLATQTDVVAEWSHPKSTTDDRNKRFALLTHVLDFDIPLLRDLHATRWYSGNTHTHYHLQIDEDPDDRLRLVPPAEALDVSVISYLIRNDSPYITNRYPIGRLPQFY